MPVQRPKLFSFLQAFSTPSRFGLHGQENVPFGTHHLKGFVGVGIPVPPSPGDASEPASEGPPASGDPPASGTPPSGISPVDFGGYFAPSTHVKPLGHSPVVVQSRAQNLSPAGAVKHASDGLRHCSTV